jgi:hypothetical protein
VKSPLGVNESLHGHDGLLELVSEDRVVAKALAQSHEALEIRLTRRMEALLCVQ